MSMHNVRMVILNASLKHFSAENVPKSITPLHKALRMKNFEMIEMLVKKGADVNGMSFQLTPLLIACGSTIRGEWPLYDTKLRLQLEEDFIGRNSFNSKIVRFLLDHGAYMEMKNPKGRTALDQSCKFADLEIVQMLLNRGARIKKGGFTTLHCAIAGKHLDVIRMILETGINVNSRCKRKGTPLHYAIREIRGNCEEIIDILVEYGADVNLADKKMQTPLHLACLSDKIDMMRIQNSSNAGIIKRLLKLNANVNALDKRGKTPLHYALYNYILKIPFKFSYNDCEPDLKILVAFCAKMIAFNKKINEENEILLKNEPIDKIYKKYEEELKSMQRKVSNSLTYSFLDILKKDLDEVGGFIENEDVKKVLDGFDYRKEFPYYGDELEERILAAKNRRSLIDLGTCLFTKHVKEQNLPVEIVLKIFKFLNLKDFENFVNACFVKVP